jgi:stage II sporulation protein AA (anti-sigma F factor antagonist)
MRRKRPPGCRVEPLESERGFRLSGELDLVSVDAVRSALEPELHVRLVLDLAGLEFIDDSGLGLLVGTFKRLREQGGSLVLRNPRPEIRRVLEMTGVARLPGFAVEPEVGSS